MFRYFGTTGYDPETGEVYEDEHDFDDDPEEYERWLDSQRDRQADMDRD